MTLKYCSLSHLFCLGILLAFLCGIYTHDAIGQTFTLREVELSSNPTDDTNYEGDREIASDTRLIQTEDWDPEKVPARITYTIDAYAKGPGKITFYLGNNANTQEVGSWTDGELSDGEGIYWFDVYRLNEDNYSWEDDYRENGKPWDDECLPYLYKGYEDEVRESTNSTLSIDGGYATYASIDTHVGGANTKQKTLEANAGWKAAGVSSGYSSNSTKSWIYRPGDTSNDIPQNHLSLSGNYSVQLNDTDTSGSQTQNPPENCKPCAGCGEYLHNEFAHREHCPAFLHRFEDTEGYYYNCVPGNVELHKLRTCSRWTCGRKYRNCFPNSPICFLWPAKHSGKDPDTSSNPGVSPANGLYTAQPGDVHEVQLVTAVPYQSVQWSVNGTNVKIDEGDGLTNEASLTHTFPNGVNGDYVINAYINTGNNDTREYSYTVSVSSSLSTTSPPPSNTVSPGLSAVNATTITINGEEMVDTAAGDTVSVDLVMPSDKGYSQIYWYLAGPNDSGYGSQLGNPTLPTGSSVETSVSYSFTLPSDASGVYTFTAYIYPHSSASDQAVYVYSFKIHVS